MSKIQGKDTTMMDKETVIALLKDARENRDKMEKLYIQNKASDYGGEFYRGKMTAYQEVITVYEHVIADIVLLENVGK